MQQKLHYLVLLVAAIFAFSFSASAKVWRVNNTAGVSADFAQISAAISNSQVQPGDTIYVEGTATTYGYTILSKRLVLIGTGYLLSGATGNAGLQFNTNSSKFSTLDVDSLASGSTFVGLEGNIRLSAGVDNITITRCNVIIDRISGGLKSEHLVFNKCLLSLNMSSALADDVQVTNCYINNWFHIPGGNNVLVRNNVINVSSPNISNGYFANNIFISSGNVNGVVNSSFKYNISVYNMLPTGNNNQNSVPYANIFVGSGSADGQYQLKAGSPAIGAGEPVNGVTPDCGMFGTADPYRLSGIPPVPTIYELTVPATVPSSATSMTATVSTRSNN